MWAKILTKELEAAASNKGSTVSILISFSLKENLGETKRFLSFYVGGRLIFHQEYVEKLDGISHA